MILKILFVLILGLLGKTSSKYIPGGENEMMKKSNLEGFIVGGQDAALGQFPHSVSIRNTSNIHFCGGSIITSRWVISAAHCTMFRNPEDTWMIVGALYLNSGGVNVFTDRILNHPDFYPDEPGDISLLQSRDEIIFSTTVSHLNLGQAHIDAGVVGTVAGWGRTGPQDDFPNTLQWIHKNTISNEECFERLPGADANILQDNMICTVNQPGEGMCSGDSGSALFFGNTAIGIVSWGIWPCGGGHPDVFTRISTYYTWLVEQMTS